MQANPHYARVIGTRVYSDVSTLLYAVLSIREFVCMCCVLYVCVCIGSIHTHLNVYMCTF